ncbi:hypothetical protein EK21DRAFT_88095 [Setomelanomma holmii]|uniref:Uncharacterized protein n=1 Tax=Setomelanomma holmii TaxID=210430 RepID=A0A9P4LMX2_9PLEO|nr:hypothetical protein EK21DRAFT_88095 [Setomelanomma holmii]
MTRTKSILSATPQRIDTTSSQTTREQAATHWQDSPTFSRNSKPIRHLRRPPAHTTHQTMPPSIGQRWKAARLHEIRAAEACRLWQERVDELCWQEARVRADLAHVSSLPSVRQHPLSWVELPPPGLVEQRTLLVDEYSSRNELLGRRVLSTFLALLARVDGLRVLTRRRLAVEIEAKTEYVKKVHRGEKLTEEEFAAVSCFVGGKADKSRRHNVSKGDFVTIPEGAWWPERYHARDLRLHEVTEETLASRWQQERAEERSMDLRYCVTEPKETSVHIRN